MKLRTWVFPKVLSRAAKQICTVRSKSPRNLGPLWAEEADVRVVLLSLVLALAAGSGCSAKKYAIGMIGDAIASGGTTYESDEDIKLVGDALPFSLKLIESLLAETPRHKGLLLAGCKGFTTYAYAFVQQEGDRVAETNVIAGNKIRTRARKLFLRGHDYCGRGLEIPYRGVTEKLLREPKAALTQTKKKDVPWLYWSAASLGLAVSVSRGNATMLARLPEVEALLERARELNEGWEDGSLHEFQVTLAGAKPGRRDYDMIQKHYQRALELSGGTHAGLYVAYAEAVSIPKQDRAEFRQLLEKGLAIDVDKHKDVRVANLVAQQRAQWLLDRTDDLIFTLEPEAPPEN